MGLLDGKVALITGAARGIGRSIALKYASEGANVAFTDLVINEAAEQTVKDIEAFGHKVKAYASNAADFEETQKVVDQVVAEFGRIDILVNNAGITKDGLMLRMSEAQWDAVIAVNLKSSWRVRKCRPVQLLCFKGRPYRACQINSQRNGTSRNTRQLHSSGVHRLCHDRGSAGKSSRRVDTEDSASQGRHDRGYRQRGYLPCQRHGILRVWAGHPG